MTVGWREWVSLPDLFGSRIKAKIDTGARTSALHAFRIHPIDCDGELWVEFLVHPVQRRRRPEILCAAPVHGIRTVTSSSGHREDRYVIRTSLEIGDAMRSVDVTLTDRDQLGFRVLIGREAIRDRYLVDPGKSYLSERIAGGNET